VAEQPVTFGVLIGTRGIFNPAHAQSARRELLEKLDSLGYSYLILPEDSTPNGAVESLDDIRKYAKFFRDHQDEIDGIIVSLPNFGDEIAVAETLWHSKLNVPVLIQAYPDDPTKVGVEERRDSFCGKLSVCNNLYQYDIPWSDTLSHVVDVKSDEFTQDLDRFTRICRTVKGLTSARIGAIGTRPKPFQTVRYSEKLLQETGITVVPVDMSQILAEAQSMDAKAKAVNQKEEEIRDYGTIPDYIEGNKVTLHSKLSVAIDNWMAENECDASAIQCWDSVQLNYGCATCVSMAMMGERLMPSACEVDVTGVVSMYALALVSGNAPGFLDWNNNYANEKDKVVGTHCCNYPKSFVGRDVEISNLDVLGKALGKENSFGAIKAKVAPGPMTYFRMSTDDKLGMIRSYAGEGEFTDDEFPMHGGVAVCKIPNMRRLFRYVTKNGFEHHVAMVRGNWADLLQEAATTYLGWDFYGHNLDED
jgi:L-fucose isomerase-like protein